MRNPPVILVAAACVISALGYAMYIFGSPIPGERFILVLPPVLIAAAAAVILTRSLNTRALPWIFVGLVALSAVSVQLFGASFSAGMDAADAGRQAGPLANLALPIGVAGILASGAAAGLLLGLTLLRRRPPPQRAILAALAGLLLAVPLFVLQFNPMHAVILSFVVLLVLVLPRTLSKTGTQSKPGTLPEDQQHQTVAQPASPQSLRILGALALVILLAVWGAGAWVGFREMGRPEATTAMGIAAGAATFAALPLVRAAALIGQARTSRRRWVTASFLPLVGITAATIIQLIGYSPDGSGLFTAAGIAGVSVGVWLAIAIDSSAAMPHVRIAVALALTIGGTVVWFYTVPTTGGILLVVPALLLIFRGRRFSRPAVAVS
ncbi:hypothetical protein BJ994_003321 [Arthrobacter pigmenti]|uniref:Uncharacterized protein n=1 Tax=Arthrobacter pigmenti TaxID=271432 RepID=A0A846RXD5_9MICC|nr:hypothetical protein [Arthrobacter pigmenti]NJC24245.1 hypothetical protein [Arthrobacter pigmenti]